MFHRGISIGHGREVRHPLYLLLLVVLFMDSIHRPTLAHVRPYESAPLPCHAFSASSAAQPLLRHTARSGFV